MAKGSFSIYSGGPSDIGLFRNNFITPFRQADEDLGIAEFGVFIFQVCSHNAPSLAAGTAGIDLDFISQHFWQYFLQGRPADGCYGIQGGVPHKAHSLAQQKYLYFMAGFGKRVPMEEGEGGSRRIIRPPSAFDKDLQFVISPSGGAAKKRQWEQVS